MTRLAAIANRITGKVDLSSAIVYNLPTATAHVPPNRWAQATLEEHAGDPRPALLPYNQLDCGASGDAFWDAAQKQLVRTGGTLAAGLWRWLSGVLRCIGTVKSAHMFTAAADMGQERHVVTCQLARVPLLQASCTTTCA